MALSPGGCSLGSPVLISTAMLPDEETVFFQDSSFFKHHMLSDLPTTDQIYAAALPGYARFVSIFPSLSLAVKRVRATSRHRASAAGGQTLWALRQFLPEVLVPEVYGWRRDGDELFLFMELIMGECLHDRWKDLTEQEKTQICAELGTMVRALRRLKRPPEEEFIGAIGGQPSMETLCFGVRSDPYPNSEAFYEFFMRIPSSEREMAHEEGLPQLPYDSPIVFTHCDLNFSNIMITPRSADQCPRVLAIIDWEQSGWMPSFWEYSKPMFWMMLQGEETRDMMTRLSKITGDVSEKVFMAFVTYVQTHGGLI